MKQKNLGANVFELSRKIEERENEEEKRRKEAAFLDWFNLHVLTIGIAVLAAPILVELVQWLVTG